VKHAMTLCILLVGATVLAVLLLTLVERGQGLEFIDVMFETVSAFSTAGLSTGMAGELSGGGKLVMTVVMLVGRVLPLSLALIMIGSVSRARYTYATERITIG
ncbi:MAG: Trk family potassium uptake protein, partial [Chloroflexota bacterium]|nr:Trk family potassium uptake protein [Chloroflexota bacterium]